MHQIVVTQDYVVVMDTGFKIGPEQLLSKPVLQNKKLEAILRKYLDYPESPESRLYIVNRVDLTSDRTEVTVKPVTIERAAVHLLADYENPENRITLHIAHTAALDLSEWVRPYDTTEAPPEANAPIGMTVGPVDVHSLGRYVIDAVTGTVDEAASRTIYDEHLTWNASIGVYNDRHTTPKIESLYWNFWGGWSDLLTDFIQNLYQKYPRLIPLETVVELTQQGVASSLCRLDTASAEQFAIADSYAFPPGYFCQSPQFVPRLGGGESPTNGYILCAMIYGNNSEMWLFDAQNLKAGPVCQLSHPQFKFAMTAHSTWLPKIAPRQGDYYIDVRQDYQLLVEKQPEAIQKLFEESVYPNFPDSKSSSSWPPVPATIVVASRSELTDLRLNVQGHLPSDLQGHFFMEAPVGSVASGGLPYPKGDNVFNGDGMIYRFDFDTPGEVKATTRLAKPPCYYADLATQTQPEYAKYKFRNFGVERFSPHLGARKLT
jgi:carotenoid cleavage dioxygenase-like enzyme